MTRWRESTSGELSVRFARPSASLSASVSRSAAGHDEKQGTFVPLPFAWRVEVAHGRLLRQRRLARSFGNTLESATGRLEVAYLAVALHAVFSSRRPGAAAHRRSLGPANFGRRNGETLEHP
jgi:hypothetical protein